jgi:hypothetical protein
MKQMDGVDRYDVDRISHLNAIRNFNYDPFSVIPKEECTVGALRRQAAGHDVSIKAKGKRQSAGTLASQLGPTAKR